MVIWIFGSNINRRSHWVQASELGAWRERNDLMRLTQQVKLQTSGHCISIISFQYIYNCLSDIWSRRWAHLTSTQGVPWDRLFRPEIRPFSSMLWRVASQKCWPASLYSSRASFLVPVSVLGTAYLQMRNECCTCLDPHQGPPTMLTSHQYRLQYSWIPCVFGLIQGKEEFIEWWVRMMC